MCLHRMDDTHITSTTTAHNKWHGIYIFIMNNTHIYNTNTTQNEMYGMLSDTISSTRIINTTSTQNKVSGIHLFNMENTYISNTTTMNNNVSGIGLYSMYNTLIISTTTTHNAVCGMYLHDMENTHIINTIATHNSEQGMHWSAMNNTFITNTTATPNSWYYSPHGGPVFIGQIEIVSSTHTLIYNSSFTDIYAPSIANTEDSTSLPAVIVLHWSTVYVSGCLFKGNNISSVRAHASNITLSGNLTFSNNRAFVGTALILAHDTILSITDNSHIHFLNNHATNAGGVFYITSSCIHLDAQYLSRSTCFLNIEGSRSQKRLTFVNNSAGKGGDILYGGHVTLGIDGHWSCLDSFKNVSNISQNGLSLISSDPSRVCVCNGSGQHDCQIVAGTNPHPVYPGQYISIPAVLVGQDFGTVTGSVYAQFLQKSSAKNPPQFETWQTVQAVTQRNCSHLKYTIFSLTEVLEAVLVLTAHDSYVSRLLNNNIDSNACTLWTSTYKTIAVEPLMKNNNPIYINTSLLPCPSGFMLTTDPPFRCDCNMLLQKINEFQCHIQQQTISRSGLLWVGMIQDDKRTNGTVAVSEYCPLDYCKKEKSNVTLSEPDTQCEHNHSGVLCEHSQWICLPLRKKDVFICFDNVGIEYQSIKCSLRYCEV